MRGGGREIGSRIRGGEERGRRGAEGMEEEMGKGKKIDGYMEEEEQERGRKRRGMGGGRQQDRERNRRMRKRKR